MLALARAPRRALLAPLGLRRFSSDGVHFNATDAEVEELIERNIVSACKAPRLQGPLRRGHPLSMLAAPRPGGGGREEAQLQRQRTQDMLSASRAVPRVQDRTTYRKKDEPHEERLRVLTTRREALSL